MTDLEKKYAKLAPFSLTELVEAANSVLRDRPRLKTSERTVRYYIANHLLPPPSGSNKHARYRSEHLRRLVAIREWLDEGISLDDARKKLAAGEHGGETEIHPRLTSKLLQDRMVQRSASQSSDMQIQPPERVVKRIYLTAHCVLELDQGTEELREMQRAARSLRRIIENHQDST